jgi:hypothetical protein
MDSQGHSGSSSKAQSSWMPEAGIAVEFLRIPRFVLNIKDTLKDSNSAGVRIPGAVRYDSLVGDER